QAMGERSEVVGVDFLGCLLAALLDLRAKAALLLGGVVQLGEAVRQFHPGDEQLKTLGKRRVVLAALRERRDFRREVVNKRRLDQVFFEERFKERAAWRGRLGWGRRGAGPGGPVFANGFEHRETLEAAEIDPLLTEADLDGAA